MACSEQNHGKKEAERIGIAQSYAPDIHSAADERPEIHSVAGHEPGHKGEDGDDEVDKRAETDGIILRNHGRHDFVDHHVDAVYEEVGEEAQDEENREVDRAGKQNPDAHHNAQHDRAQDNKRLRPDPVRVPLGDKARQHHAHGHYDGVGQNEIVAKAQNVAQERNRHLNQYEDADVNRFQSNGMGDVLVPETVTHQLKERNLAPFHEPAAGNPPVFYRAEYVDEDSKKLQAYYPHKSRQSLYARDKGAANLRQKRRALVGGVESGQNRPAILDAADILAGQIVEDNAQSAENAEQSISENQNSDSPRALEEEKRHIAEAHDAPHVPEKRMAFLLIKTGEEPEERRNGKAGHVEAR